MIERLVFLQNLPANNLNTPPAGLGAASAAVIISYFIFWILVYVFTSFAYTSIGKKAGLRAPALAWIPGLGPLIIAFRASRMHWWPWVLSLGFVAAMIAGISAYFTALSGEVSTALISFMIVGFAAVAVFAVYTIVWHWKMFQAIGRPGWWAILWLIPIVNFIIIGIAAWSKSPVDSTSVQPAQVNPGYMFNQ